MRSPEAEIKLFYAIAIATKNKQQTKNSLEPKNRSIRETLGKGNKRENKRKFFKKFRQLQIVAAVNTVERATGSSSNSCFNYSNSLRGGYV